MKPLHWIFVMLVASGLGTAQDAKHPPGPAKAEIYTDAKGKTLPYRLLMPTQESGKKYPLVLFFHGAGERGVDNARQLVHFPFRLNDAKIREANPVFVLAPQCPPAKQWVEMPWGPGVGKRPQQPSEPMRLAMELLDHIIKTYPIDTDRVYVTGLSMGGFATWDALTRHPEKFAAGFPICGGGDPASVTPAAAKIPVWAFHSADDGAVKVAGSREMVKAWKREGGEPRYTEYKNKGHGSWGPAWSEPEALPWLLSKRRPAR